jgi:hypothetical protein
MLKENIIVVSESMRSYQYFFVVEEFVAIYD